MKTFLASCCLALACSVIGARAAETETGRDTLTLKLSQLDKVRTFRAMMPWASLKVRGTDGDEVRIVVTYPEKAKPAVGRMIPENFRRLNGGSDTAYQVMESGEAVVLYGGGRQQWSALIEVELPRRLGAALQARSGGDIEVEEIEGDLELTTSMAGALRLRGVTGAITASVGDGEIDLTLGAKPVKPVSLNSSAGEVTVRLPAQAAASLKLRAFSGAIYTDFPDDALQVAPVKFVRPKPADPRTAAALANARVYNGGQLPDPRAAFLGGQVLAGDLNGGGAEVSAATVNGSIIIRRAE